MNIIRSFILSCFIWFVLPFVYVQGAVIYTCNFENAAERSQWQMNQGPAAQYSPNNWYIGEPGNCEETGHWGLYLSNDGKNSNYDATSGTQVVAWRDLPALPAGDYELRFSWRCNGKPSGSEGLYVCILPVSMTTNTGVVTAPQDWVTKNMLNEEVLANSSVWEEANLPYKSDGTASKLVFVWINTMGRAVPPAACVDNIEIVEKVSCTAPKNLTFNITDTDLQISWQGNAQSYDVKVYDLQTDKWQYFNGITTKQVLVSGLSEGTCNVYVRSNCGSERSSWTVEHPFFFHKNVRCIDYMDLNNSNCSYSLASNIKPANMRANVRGVHSELHQLCHIPDEYDYYTNNELKTKPDDVLASVKLGRFIDTHLSQVEYKYVVPEDDKAILKVRYACVLPNPHPDSPEDNPVFSLEILANNVAIPNECGSYLFVSGNDFSMKDWNYSEVGGPTYWKDWTSVSINLSDYVGQTITVRIKVTGCGLTAHGGYAYLVMECESNAMSGLNCGEDNPSTDFLAPEGFNYYWYELDNAGNKVTPTLYPNADNKNRKWTISPMDTLTYYVDIISREKPNCYYTMEVSGIPRYPVPLADYEIYTKDCQNYVSFTDKSYIEYKNQITDDKFSKDENVSHVYIDFGDGSALEDIKGTTEHQYPKEGGHFTATLWAGISEDVCVTSYKMEFDLPNKLATEQDIHLSVGQSFGDRLYFFPYQFDSLYVDELGCEKIFHVYVHEKDFRVDTSFCEGGYYLLGKDTIRQSVSNRVANLKNIWGLDSIVTLNLHVEPMLKLNISDTINHCSDNTMVEIPYSVIQGRMNDFIVSFDNIGQQVGFKSDYPFAANENIQISLPDGIDPGCYPFFLQLETDQCPVPNYECVLQIGYPTSIFRHKGNTLIVQNEAITGYDFDGFQWFKNGNLLEGATLSYISVDDAVQGDEFVVMLTRNGTTMPSCPIIFDGNPQTAVDNLSAEELFVYPSLIAAGEPVLINKKVDAVIYDMLGRPVCKIKNSSEFRAPYNSGIYFIITDNATTRFVVY